MQAKLGIIRDVISQAIQDETVSSDEFQKIQQEMEKYNELKEGTRRENKVKVRQIIKKKHLEELLETRKKRRSIKCFYEKLQIL